MPFPTGPAWTDPRVNAPAHASDELLPLIPKLLTTILNHLDAATALIGDPPLVDLDVFEDTGLHEVDGLRELWWPDWDQLITYVEDQVQYKNIVRSLKEKYLGGTGSQANPDQIDYPAWSRDNPRLARSFCGQILLLLVAEAPVGNVFRQDPSDPLTWGFFPP